MALEGNRNVAASVLKWYQMQLLSAAVRCHCLLPAATVAVGQALACCIYLHGRLLQLFMAAARCSSLAQM